MQMLVSQDSVQVLCIRLTLLTRKRKDRRRLAETFAASCGARWNTKNMKVPLVGGGNPSPSWPNPYPD